MFELASFCHNAMSQTVVKASERVSNHFRCDLGRGLFNVSLQFLNIIWSIFAICVHADF